MRSERSAVPDRTGWSCRLPLGDGSSVIDCLDAKLLEAFELVRHRLEDVGGVPRQTSTIVICFDSNCRR